MRAISPNEGAASSVNHWSRMLGVTLRPWSGHAPWWLVLRGIIQLAVCLLFMRLTQQFMSSAIAAGLDAEHPSLRSGGVLLMVVLIILAVLAAARTLVGLIDLVPRRVVKGTVLSVRERRVGDMLPPFAQRAIFMRGQSGLDRRRTRTEVVLQTAQGIRQWTVRNARIRRELRDARQVQLTVSPLVGYVAQATSIA